MRRLDCLTGLRAVAAYSVLLAHAIDAGFMYSGASLFHGFASRLAYFGMTLFFVLSGFVIYYNYADLFAGERLPVASYKFFVARFARLYPLYALVILVSILKVPIPDFSAHPWVAVAYATLTQSWVNVEQIVFPPAWSVSTEWFFYLAFVPLVFVIMRVRRPAMALAVFSLAAAGLLMAVLHAFEGAKTRSLPHWLWSGPGVSADLWGWLIYYAPLTRIWEFIVGMLAAKAYRAGRLRSRAPAAAQVIMATALIWCAAVLLIAPLTEDTVLNNLRCNFIDAPALGALLCLCAYDTRLSRWLAARPFVLGGEISYSVYIWSFSVIDILAPGMASPALSLPAFTNSAIKIGLCVMLTTIFAYGSFLLIETPARVWLRRIMLRPLQARVAVAPRVSG